MDSRRAFVVWLAVLVALAPLLAIGPSGAAAQPTDVSSAADGDATRQVTTVSLESGDSTWQGWSLSFNGSVVIGDPGSASAGERTFQLRQISEDGVVGDLVREFTVGQDGLHQLVTDELVGRYVLLYGGDPVYVQDGVGYLSDPPDGTTVTANASAWRVERQTLDATWSTSSAYDGQIISLSLDSNRADYTVGVSAPSLSYSELTQLFDEADYAADHDARSDENVLLLDPARAPFVANLSGLSPGEYLVTFQVTDTTGRARPLLTVNNPSGPQIAAVERVTPAGDRLTLTADCGTCYLIVGSQSLNFLDVVELTDTDGDGTVSVAINSRYLGLSQGSSDVPTGAAFTALTDDIDVYGPSRELDSGYTLQRVRNEVKPQITDDPPTPLAHGQYDLRLASSDTITIPHNRLSFDDVTDITTVRLTQPALQEMVAVAAPRGEPGDLAIDTINTDSPRDRVAVGDRLVFRIQATGLFGYFAATGTDIGSVLDNPDEGLSLRLRPADDRATPIRLDRGDPRLLVDPSTNRLYVIIDTRDLRIEEGFQPGRSYRAVFERRGVDAETYDVNRGPDFHDGYPYLEPGATESMAAEFELVEPAASAADPLQVANVQSITITGTTTVAPGTELRLSIVETDRSWEKSGRTTVADGGTWQATFDFSNAKANQSFTITVKRGLETLGTTEGAVVTPSATQTATPADSGDTTTSPPPTSASGTPADDGPDTGTAPAGNATATGSPDGGSGLLGFLPGGPIALAGVGLLVLLLGGFLYYGFRS